MNEVLTATQAEEILDNLEEKMEVIISSGTICGSVSKESLDELSSALEEYGDVLEGVQLYEAIAPAIYGMVSFVRQNQPEIQKCGEPIWGMFKSMALTMTQLRHALFSYDDINRDGFYHSFENDCNMLKNRVLGVENQTHQSVDNILNF